MSATVSRFVIGVAAMLMLATVVGGCGTRSTIQDTTADPTYVTATAFPIDMTDEALLPVYSTWVNMLGLRQLDPPAVWRVRLSEACTLGVWNKTVAVDLATRYIAEDASLSARIPELGPAPVEDAADALWLMAVQPGVCRDTYPAAAIDAGPPFLDKSPQR